MSRLTGVFYYDLREVCSQDQDWVRRLGQCDDALEFYTVPGLLMAWSAPAASLPAKPAVGPSVSAWGHVCAFDGRLDNSSELPGEGAGPDPGRSIRREQPSDHALALYEKEGPAGLARLIGDWSLVIWDAISRTVLLASDYAGVRPLYFHRTSERLIWSTSLTHIAQWAGAGVLDEEYAAAFLTGGAAGNRSPYAGVQPVPAGCSVRATRDQLITSRYWNYPTDQTIRYRDDSEYEERMRSLFLEAVAVRLNTNARACAELSGGLDSSSVVCAASHLMQSGAAKAHGLSSFTYCYPGSTDEKFYRAVEQHCGISRIHLNTGEHPPLATDCAGDAAPLLWAPRFAEVRRRMAAIGADVFLTGQLGDLIMGNWLDDSEQAGDYLRGGHVWPAVREAYAWSQALQIPIYSVLWRAVRSDSSANSDLASADRLTYGDSVTERLRKRLAPQEHPSRAAWLRGASPTRRKRLQALAQVLESRILQCPEPLQAVSFSHPFSHRPLVEFMLAIPPAQVCRPEMPRRLQRRALSGIVPEAVLNRRSKSNYGGMFTASMRPCAAELLKDVSRMRLAQLGYVDPASVQVRLQRLIQGLDCNEPQLRQLILLELWLRNKENAGNGACAPVSDSIPQPLTPLR